MLILLSPIDINKEKTMNNGVRILVLLPKNVPEEIKTKIRLHIPLMEDFFCERFGLQYSVLLEPQARHIGPGT